MEGGGRLIVASGCGAICFSSSVALCVLLSFRSLGCRLLPCLAYTAFCGTLSERVPRLFSLSPFLGKSSLAFSLGNICAEIVRSLLFSYSKGPDVSNA